MNTSNVSVIDGCYNGCVYCPHSIGTDENPIWDNVHKKYGKRKLPVLFPYAHDITPWNMSSCMPVIHKLLKAGNEVIISTKGHLKCIVDICYEAKDYKDKLSFQFSIGSCQSSVLKKWEPNATSFEERFECLHTAYNLGFKTSVNISPLLDEDLKIIRKINPYVTDHIYIKKAEFSEDLRLAQRYISTKNKKVVWL